ncbi:MAG: hypothetical protein POELPBGB_01486 [Bacteroidia bacterium]|nr:hypothetical protein [Bacteroidia bacterium]
MRVVNKTNSGLIVLTLLLINGCANIVTPTGGDKDTAPPKVLELIPPNQSLNFNSKSFIISFDEFVQLNDISTQLIVSPPLKAQPEFLVKGKSVVVKFNEELLPNTTYTMNFGSAIRDINENNPMEGFTYVFSTGTYIDSLSLRGTVKNALSMQNEKDVLVLLYEENTDSIPYLKTPYYYAKTDGSGNFALNNLKSGQFKVVALKDENSSFLYDDFDKEMIGFVDTLVSPYYMEKAKPQTSDTLKPDSVTIQKNEPQSTDKGVKKVSEKSLPLFIFKEQKNKQYFKKAYSEYFGKLVFIFNKKPEKLELNTLNTSFKKEWNIQEQSVTGDTLTLWLSDVEIDSLKIEIADNGIVLDTVELALKKRSDKVETQITSSKGAKKSVPFKLLLEQGKVAAAHNAAKDFYITFNHPVKNYVVENFVLKEDSIPVKFSLASNDPALRKYTINYNWKEEKKYELFIPPSSVTDIFDLKNDSIKINFTTQAKSYFGNVQFTIKAAEADYILQLTDDKSTIVFEKPVKGNEKISVEGLDPQSYLLRLVVDQNNNRKWDTGNYLQHRQAEKIILHPQKVSVRSNWDVEVEWEVK